MDIAYPDRENLGRRLKETGNNSLNFIVLVTAVLDPADSGKLKAYLADCVRVLKDGGLLFLQGCPEYLPELGVYLDQHLDIRYWIAIART